MDQRQVHETIKRLVEANYDQRAIPTRLREFENSNAPPLPPGEFESLQDFLDFYGRKQSYENGIRDLKAELDNAKKQYDEARKALSRVLPVNVPLHYAYDGEREALQGRWYMIRKLGRGRLEISSRRPASP